MLGEVARVVNGAAFSSRLFNVVGRGLPLIRIRDVGADNSSTWYEGSFDQVYEVNRDDILVGMDGDFRAARWRGPRGLLNQRVCRLDVNEDVYDSRFLVLVLQGYLDAIWKHTSSVTVKHLSSRSVAAIPLPRPELHEQRRIVEILEDHLSRLDAAASGLRLAKRRLRLMAASAISAIGNEAAETAGGVPLGSLAIASGYGTSAKCVTKGAGPAVVRIPNLIEGTIDLSDEKRVQDGSLDVSGLMLDPGDLLFVRTNGSRDLIGRTGVVQEGVRAAFASYLIRYKLDVARLRPQWVHLMMQTPATRRLMESLAASSAGQYNLSLSKLNRVAVPVPTLDEQDRLLARFRSVEECVGRLRGELAGLDARGKGLRQSLLTAAFEGRLTDRVDEAVRRAELAGV